MRSYSLKEGMRNPGKAGALRSFPPTGKREGLGYHWGIHDA